MCRATLGRSVSKQCLAIPVKKKEGREKGVGLDLDLLSTIGTVLLFVVLGIKAIILM